MQPTREYRFTVKRVSDIIITFNFCSIVTEDFNAMFRNWQARDINSNAGKELDSLIARAGPTQLIDKPTGFFSGGSSCIDPIYFSKSEPGSA